VIGSRLKRVPGRKAIVLFTDGVDTTSRVSYLEKNLRDAGELDAIIFPIQYDTYADVKRIEREGKSGVKLPGSTKTIPVGGGLPGITIGGDDDRQSTMDYPGRRSPNDPSNLENRNPSIGGSPGTSAKDYQVADKFLADLAERTGGRVHRVDTFSDLATAFDRIAKEL
jgi:hypothetical protein